MSNTVSLKPATIPFTQFLRPHGHTRLIEAPIPEGCEEKVDKLLKLGYVFSCELLCSDVSGVALYCGKTVDDENELLVLSPNIIEELDKNTKILVDDAYREFIENASKG